ncbi:MAG: GTPase HflX [Fidelibacterota bacterium]
MSEREIPTYERAVLVGVVQPGMTQALVEEHLDELALLVETAGADVVSRFVQKRERVNPTYFIGKGKAQQVVQQAKELNIQLIIFDDELSPSQIRNFLKLADNIKIMDRTGLILDIFRRHAKSREAKTQVELAHLQYLLPRLTRLWTHLERQMGGIGTRAGAGETQIEVDRRIIRDRIAKLRKDLQKINNERITQSKRRKGLYRVALVGYTNAGKSTLMNALTGADVFVQNQLFATLDTTVRLLDVNEHHRLLLSDSVGFIRKLPHTLVASFRSTLMEVLEADLLLIVLDGSTSLLDEQLQTVGEVLGEIGAREKDVLLVINKIDLIEDQDVLQGLKARFPKAIFISALHHLRLDALLVAIVDEMEKSYRTATVIFDPGLGKEIATVFKEVEVLKTTYRDDGVHLTIRGEKVRVDRLKALAGKNGPRE